MSYKIYTGDCLDILKSFEDELFDMVYLDPPFLTQKIQKLRTKDRQKEYAFPDIWGSTYEYIIYLEARLKEIHRTLKNTGSIFFHCDRNTSHLARCLLDKIFGANMFKSEIIWHYRRWSNNIKGLNPAHQNIYFYSKSNKYVFSTIYENYSPTTNIDQILQRRKRDSFGKTIYDRDLEGNVVVNGGKKGVPLSDVWDIPYLNPKAKERTGYPTQKPIILLERIINISTNEDDLILDPFCGSGTTLVAASLLKRQSIGIDISEEAIEITKRRLKEPLKTYSKTFNLGRESFENINKKILALLEGIEYAPVQRNNGMDAVLKNAIDGKPIFVKIQRQDETILEAAQLLYKASRGKKASLLLVIATKGGGYIQFGDDFPNDIKIIEAPSVLINKVILDTTNRINKNLLL